MPKKSQSYYMVTYASFTSSDFNTEKLSGKIRRNRATAQKYSPECSIPTSELQIGIYFLQKLKCYRSRRGKDIIACMACPTLLTELKVNIQSAFRLNALCFPYILIQLFSDFKISPLFHTVEKRFYQVGVLAMVNQFVTLLMIFGLF